MSHQLIRVSSSAYLRLARAAGELQSRMGHRVSLSDALDYLLHKRSGKARRFFKQLKKRRHLLGRGARRQKKALPAPKVPKTPRLVLTSKNQPISPIQRKLV